MATADSLVPISVTDVVDAMLFNSYEFLFGFLPVALVAFWWLSRYGQRLTMGWLTLASFAFYGWQTPYFLLLLAGSLVINYAISSGMRYAASGGWVRRCMLALGVLLNLGFIGYFKYSCFLLQNLNTLIATGLAPHAPHQLVLPIGISFYTFQQIAYLVDRSRDEIDNYNFVDYCLFVTFFPQLIAGPIVHPKEMLPQFTSAGGLRLRSDNVAIGATIFFMGLFKKSVLADGLIHFSGDVFTAAEQGAAPTLIEAWCAALAYTLQLYFDFSGYSDMAIGLARLFGIRLPLNFNSPYQAVNVIDFWRRWHMTLSRFLRDYVYFPLGGGRVGNTRRYFNLMMTMVLGGLWHGAGWTFVLWGTLHGLYLVINHGWHAIKKRIGMETTPSAWWSIAGSRGITFLAVLCGWVLFRATSLAAAGTMFQSMLGLNGIVLPIKWLNGSENLLGLMSALQSSGVTFAEMRGFRGWGEVAHLAGLLVVVWFAPNTQQILGDWQPAYESLSLEELQSRPGWAAWQPTPRWALVSSLVTVAAVLHLSRATEFLYFQF